MSEPRSAVSPQPPTSGLGRAIPPGPIQNPQYITFKLSPEQYSRWSTLLACQRRSKEEALIAGMEALLGGQPPGRSGDAGYLVIIQHCPACRQATLPGNRGDLAAPRALLEAGQCDGIIQDQEARRRRAVPPRLRRRVLLRDGHRCQAQGCGHSTNLEMHHRRPVARGGQSSLDNLVTLCSRCQRRLHEQEEALRRLNRGPEG